MKILSIPIILASSFAIAQDQADSSSIAELDPLSIQSSPLKVSTNEATQAWSVLEGTKLERSKSNTLGQTLSKEPGVSQSFYGPSASRPIIRGLDKNRITILENGVSSFDVSSSSEDHAVPLDPSMIERIEILRGSAALLYGGNAIGGVVNVIDNSIPTQSYADSAGGSFLSSYTSINKGWNVGANAYGGSDSLSFQLNGLKKEYWEYESPNGKVKNSMGDRSSFGIGGSHIMESGYAGLSYSNYESSYNIPGEHAENKTRLETKRDRFEFRSEIEVGDSDWLQGIDVNIGFGDYEHSEIGMENGALPFETHATYLRKGWDGRVTLNHEIGSLRGAFGLHGQLDDFKIVSEHGESIFAGKTINPAISSEDTTKLALFLVEEFDMSESTTANGGFRWEYVDREFTATPSVADKSDSIFSASAGLTQTLSELWNVSGNLNYSERLPESSELFSDGAHHATEGYEIGDPSLGKESSRGVEVVLRRTSGKVTGQLAGFFTKFNNYIFLHDTGVHVDEDGNLEPAGGFPAGTEEFPQRKYEGVKADFYGLEMELDWLAIENPGWSLILSAYGDTLRGKNKSENDNLPRIAPARLGFGFEVQQEKLSFGADLKRSFKQDDVSKSGGHGHGGHTGEEETPAYTMLNAFASYDLDIMNSQGQVFVRGNNLTDELAHVHTSFLKESAPLPGRSVEIGLKFDF